MAAATPGGSARPTRCAERAAVRPRRTGAIRPRPFKASGPSVRSPHRPTEDTMGFLDRLFGSDDSARQAPPVPQNGYGQPAYGRQPPDEPAAQERGRGRDRALPLPAAHRAARDDRAGARRGVLEAHRAAAAAGARRAVGRAAALRAAALDRSAGDGARGDPRRVHEPRLHGAHARPAAPGPVVRLHARLLDPRHRRRLRRSARLW